MDTGSYNFFFLGKRKELSDTSIFLSLYNNELNAWAVRKLVKDAT